MQENVVLVTLHTKEFCRDFELPADVELAVLYPRLLAALQKAGNRVFGTWNGLLLATEEGVLLDLKATLWDYGICTGNYLRIEQEA